jgi:hypothetical protein
MLRTSGRTKATLNKITTEIGQATEEAFPSLEALNTCARLLDRIPRPSHPAQAKSFPPGSGATKDTPFALRVTIDRPPDEPWVALPGRRPAAPKRVSPSAAAAWPSRYSPCWCCLGATHCGRDRSSLRGARPNRF